MSSPRTGRPPQYTELQVLKGIDLVERAGGAPTGESVKQSMCAELGVPQGINAQSLDREVHRLLEDRARARRERLVTALPAATRTAATEIGARLEFAVLDHLAEEHDRLRIAAGERIVEMSDDLDCQRSRIRELLTQIEARDARIAELERTRQDAEQRLATAAAEIASLQSRLAVLEQAEDLRAQMLAMMREALAQNPQAAA